MGTIFLVEIRIENLQGASLGMGSLHIKVIVSDIEGRDYNWASEASPTLGCSIEISRDICCRYAVCCMSVVCQINCVGGITCGPRAWPVLVFSPTHFHHSATIF